MMNPETDLIRQGPAAGPHQLEAAGGETILVIDIGNSQTVFGWFADGCLQAVFRQPTPGNRPNSQQPPADDRQHDDWASELARQLADRPTANLSAIVIASVVPPVTAGLVDACRHLTGLEPILAGPDTAGIPMRVDYPLKVGTDRIANAVAAAGRFPLPVIVMDLGTATTLSVVNRDGHFIGGTISPGLQTAARALHQQTAQLPLSDLGAPAAAIGRNTEACIRSGLVLGSAAMLEGLASRMEAELGEPATLVLTGGLASRVRAHLNRPSFYEPDLLLLGLVQIARQQLANGRGPVPAAAAGDPQPLPRLAGRRIGLVGAGRVGITLGAYLARHGFNIAGYLSRSPESARQAARITHSQAFSSAAALMADADCILITTPDDQIAAIARDLLRSARSGQWLMHCSGSQTAGVLADRTATVDGIALASLHPMAAFSQRTGQCDNLVAACFALEGDETAVAAWRLALTSLGHPVIRLTAGQKPLYHLANVLAANLSLSLVSLACQYLVRLGLTDGEAAAAVLPLLQANLDNFNRLGLPGALTGPIDRNDPGTIRKHLAAIPPDDRSFYIHLSRHLLALARQKHPGRDDHLLASLLQENPEEDNHEANNTDIPTG